jgi:enoyl-CoA hydratase/carnithine racemase
LDPSAATDEVLLEVEQRDRGSVYVLCVNRPARLNILDSAVISAMKAALAGIAEDDGARAVILRGSGDRAWIGGADIREMAALDSTSARSFISGLHGVCRALRELPVPIVARIDGFCLGAGLEVAACCDVRIATAESRFGMPEVQVGIPSVIEAALLPRLIGSGRTRDLVLTGRVVDSQQALSWGLVESVVPAAQLDEVVEERLTMILNAGPGAIRAQKTLCRKWEELPLDEAIQAGIDAFADAYHSNEPREYMQRFLDRPRN